MSAFLNVCRVKLGLHNASRHKLATELIAGCNVVSLDAVVEKKAMQIELQAQISYGDALIVAAALLSGCDTHTQISPNRDTPTDDPSRGRTNAAA